MKKSADNEWFDELSKIESNVDGNDPPLYFHQYSWASQFCKGRKVIELDCRSGIGTMIISKTASKCVGLDKNREAIKYALRNFFVEGKTKFAIGKENCEEFPGFDVIVSFNSRTASKSEYFMEMVQSIFNPSSQQLTGNKTLIFGVTGQDAYDFSLVRDFLNNSCSNLMINYHLYQQSAKHPFEIKRYESGIHDSQRLIVQIESHVESTAYATAPPPSRIERDLVTVVIPTYNRANLVPESIDSALNQTYPNIEVIVVDDGSDDNTNEVVGRYGNRVKYYYKENGGIGSALNYGIKKMSGRWFKWLSSDDVLTPAAVDILVNYANETGAMMMYTDYDIIDGEGKLIKKYLEPHYPSYYEYASALWTRFIGNGSSSLIEKSCFEEVGLFDESLPSAEDYDWWLRACLLHGFTFFHVRSTTLKYRTHGDQLTEAVKHNAYLTDERIRHKLRQELITANPEWWDTLVRYRKVHSKQNRRGNPARRFLRRSLLYMPEGMRKNVLKTWQRALKPRIDGEE